MERRQRKQKVIAEVIPHSVHEFPQDPIERFNMIFAALGNSGGKCVTQLLLDDNPKTGAELHNAYLAASNRTWITSNTIQRKYCIQTLSPIGCVAEVTLKYDDDSFVKAFKSTEAGIRFGNPIAKYLLSKAAELPRNLTLLEVFGRTGTAGETRGVVNRANILELLSDENGIMTTQKIALHLGLDEWIVSVHLLDLAQNRLISYSSLKTDRRGLFKYTANADCKGKVYQQYKSYRKLTQDVIDVLFAQENSDAWTLGNLLIDKYPKWKRETLSKTISCILSHLEREGVCNRGEFIGGKKLSNASILPDGKLLAEEIVKKIKRALGEDDILLIEWKRLDWRQHAPNVINREREKSPQLNRITSAAHVALALSYIAQHPGARPGEITKGMGCIATHPIRKLLQEGRIVRVVEPDNTNIVRYFPA